MNAKVYYFKHEYEWIIIQYYCKSSMNCKMTQFAHQDIVIQNPHDYVDHRLNVAEICSIINSSDHIFGGEIIGFTFSNNHSDFQVIHGHSTHLNYY